MDQDDAKLSRGLEAVLVFACFLGLMILVTWPLAQDLSGQALGHPRLAVKTHLWQFWWTAAALKSPAWSLFHTPLLLYPTGVNTLSELGNFLVPIVSVPFQAAFGLVAGYNITLLMLFAAAGTYTYALCRRHIANRPASLIGGAVYAFLPYAWLELYSGATEIAVLVMIPLTLLQLDTCLREPGLRNGLGLGLVLFLGLMSSWYYGMYLVICAVIAFLVHVFNVARNGFLSAIRQRRILATVVAAACLGGALALPFVMAIRNTERVTEDWRYSVHDWDITAKANPDLIELLGPWQHPTSEATVGFDIQETIPYPFAVFPGFLACALALAGLGTATKLPRFMWILGILFLLLFLGPWLKLFGGTETFGFKIPLPAWFLANVSKSFAASILHSYRAMAVAALILALLAALGLARVFAELSMGSRAQAAAAALAAVLIAFDAQDSSHLKRPLQTCSIEASPALKVLRDATEPGAVINIPLGIKTHVVGTYMLDQTLHHRPILGGRVAGMRVAELYSRIPGQLHSGLGLPPLEDSAASQGRFAYLVVHWTWLSAERVMAIREMVERHAILLAEDLPRGLSVYRLR